MSDIRDDQHTAIALGGPGTSLTGNIEIVDDVDMFKIVLESGETYAIGVTFPEISGTFTPTPVLSIYNELLGPVGYYVDTTAYLGNDPFRHVVFTAPESGEYFISVGTTGGGLDRLTGPYTLLVGQPSSPANDVKGDVTTVATLAIGGQATGAIDYGGDQDWFRVVLQAGQTYRFDQLGKMYLGETRWGTLPDPFLLLYDGQGRWIASNDDAPGVIAGDLFQTKSALFFTPPETGTFYLAASGTPMSLATGTYTVRAQIVVPTPLDENRFESRYTLQPGRPFKSLIDNGDVLDVYLVAGNQYTFAMTSLAGIDGRLSIARMSDPLTPLQVAEGTSGPDATLTFIPDHTGPYRLSALNANSVSGEYQLLMTVDYSSAPANNHPPVITSNGGGETAAVSVPQGTLPVAIITGSDADGNVLTYTINGGADAGKFTINAQTGALSFVSAPDYLNPTDSNHDNAYEVVVSASDGGLSDSQTITATIYVPAFRLFAADGFAGEIGGTGTVFGTNGFQDIALLSEPGTITFDPSFNKGGDIIRLPGSANSYTVASTGSNAVLADADATYSIPIGTAGTRLVFDDGVRTLVYDTAITLGGQIVGSTAGSVTAPADGSALPTGANPAATSRLFLAQNAEAAVGGDIGVFGTSSHEVVAYRFGDLVLDPSFNKGGDTLQLSGLAQDYSARRSGSNLLLESNDGTVTIPVGTGGIALDFPGADERMLLFNAGLGAVTIADQVITATPSSLTAFG